MKMNDNMIKPLLDVHTHTIQSGHAYSSLQEMVQRASQIGLEILGITEHAPSIPGTVDPLYYKNIHVIPRDMYGVHLLIGSELNIMDTSGRLDLDESYWERMDIRIAGIHSLCYTHGTREENTAGVVAAINNPWVDIISHPGDGTAELEIEPLVKASRDAGTLLEINNSSLKPIRQKVNARANNLEILRLCKKMDVPVILGSDAHISFSIADYSFIWPLLEETDFPSELIVNDKPELFLSILANHKARRK